MSPSGGETSVLDQPMTSLDRLLTRDWTRFHPGHGPAVDAPIQRLTDLIHHRRTRENAILTRLRTDGPATSVSLAAQIYVDTPAYLLPAATRNVLAHLIDLQCRGLVKPEPGPLALSVFHLS